MDDNLRGESTRLIKMEEICFASLLLLATLGEPVFLMIAAIFGTVFCQIFFQDEGSQITISCVFARGLV